MFIFKWRFRCCCLSSLMLYSRRYFKMTSLHIARSIVVSVNVWPFRLICISLWIHKWSIHAVSRAVISVARWYVKVIWFHSLRYIRDIPVSSLISAQAAIMSISWQPGLSDQVRKHVFVIFRGTVRIVWHNPRWFTVLTCRKFNCGYLCQRALRCQFSAGSFLPKFQSSCPHKYTTRKAKYCKNKWQDSDNCNVNCHGIVAAGMSGTT